MIRFAYHNSEIADNVVYALQKCKVQCTRVLEDWDDDKEQELYVVLVPQEQTERDHLQDFLVKIE